MTSFVDIAAAGLQQGIINAGDGALTWLSITQVRIAPGRAWILSSSGLYHLVSWPQTDVTIPQAAAGLARVDQIIVSANGVVSRLPATVEQAAGITIDNRVTAANLPPNTLRLHDVITSQPGGGVLNNTGYMRDRRPWARGAHVIQDDYLPDLVGDATVRNTVALSMDMGRKARIECSGAPLKLSLDMRFSTANLNEYLLIWCLQDGQPMEPGARRGEYQNWSHGTSHPGVRHMIFTARPTPGSHFYEFRLSYNGSTQATIHRAAPIDNTNPIAGPLIMEIAEDLRPSASNGTV